MRIVVLGAEGQLGSEVAEHCASPGVELHLFDRELDVGDHAALTGALFSLRPDLVFNCAAFTDVDESERRPLDSARVNFLGAQNVALACRELDCAMVFISTDYVFDGRAGRPYNEYDQPCPVNFYGRSKLAAERYITSMLHRHFIFRTQWLFGKHGRSNFVKSIVRRARAGERLRVVADEYGSPTCASDLAESICELARTGLYGTYHLTNQGECSRLELAREILGIMGLDEELAQPVLYEELGLPCERPPYAPLDNFNLRLLGFPLLRHYREPLQEYVGWLLEDPRRLD